MAGIRKSEETSGHSQYKCLLDPLLTSALSWHVIITIIVTIVIIYCDHCIFFGVSWDNIANVWKPTDLIVKDSVAIAKVIEAKQCAFDIWFEWDSSTFWAVLHYLDILSGQLGTIWVSVTLSGHQIWAHVHLSGQVCTICDLIWPSVTQICHSLLSTGLLQGRPTRCACDKVPCTCASGHLPTCWFTYPPTYLPT